MYTSTHKHIEYTYSIHRNAYTHSLEDKDKQAACRSNPGLFMDARQGRGQGLYCHTAGYNWSRTETRTSQSSDRHVRALWGPHTHTHRALTCLRYSCQAQEAAQSYINRTYIGDLKISTTGTACDCKAVPTSPSCGYYDKNSRLKIYISRGAVEIGALFSLWIFWHKY